MLEQEFGNAEEIRQRLEEQETVLLLLRETTAASRSTGRKQRLPLMNYNQRQSAADQPLKDSSWWFAAMSSSNGNIAALPYSAKDYFAPKQSGAEVWLLSEVAPTMHDMLTRAWLPKAVRNTVFTARRSISSTAVNHRSRRWLQMATQFASAGKVAEMARPHHIANAVVPEESNTRKSADQGACKSALK